MKVAIRLQNHGVKSHPLWWVVVAPNRKNIRGRYIEHVGYWCPRMTHNVKRAAIMNLTRIKYWIGCGAVPTYRVHRLLSEYGLLPKPWYYVKSQEELAKLKPNQEELDDKKKRKLEAKQKRKQRQSEDFFSVFAQYKIGDRPKPHKRNYRRLFVELQQITTLQSKENDMLRSILIQNQFKQYQLMRQLSGTNEQNQNLQQMKKNLKRLQEDLCYLQKNTISLHPVKKNMIMEKINQLVPKVYDLERKQQKQMDQPEQTVHESLLRRKIMHQVMVKQLNNIINQIQVYYKMLQPMTKQSYLEYLVNNIGLNYNQAMLRAEEDFAQYEMEGYTPTKGDLYANYNINQQNEHEILEEFNPDFAQQLDIQDIDFEERDESLAGQEDIENVEDQGQGQEGQAQQDVQQQQQPVQGMIEEQDLAKQPEEELSEQQIAKLMQNQLKLSNQNAKTSNYFHDEQFEDVDYNLNDFEQMRQLVVNKKIVMPTGNPVHPYPDLKSYIPEQFYEIPSRNQASVVSAPSYFPEDELLRYREKIRTRKQQSAGLQKVK